MDEIGRGEDPVPATRDRLMWPVLRTSVPDILDFCKGFGVVLALNPRRRIWGTFMASASIYFFMPGG